MWGMASKPHEPTELPPLYIRERMNAASPRVTGEVLAERMGTTPATISRLLNGKRKMTLEWLYAFSRALGVPIAELFSPPSEPADTEGQLRAAMVAFGVHEDDLGRAVSAVKIFVDEDEGGDEQPSPGLPRDRSEPSNRPRESKPSGKRLPHPSS